MIKIKPLAMIVFVVVIFSLILAACAPASAPVPTANPDNPSKTAEPTKPQPVATTKSTEKIKIDLFGGNVTLPAAGDDALKAGIDAKLGTDFVVSTSPEPGVLNTRFAGGNPPDMFVVDRPTLSEYVNQGLVLDLGPYMEKLAPALQYAGKDRQQAGQINGKQYAIVKRSILPYYSLWIRQDWLDALKLKAPTTLDEFYEVALAFTEKDPDGNGKKDTFGLSGDGSFFGVDKNCGSNAFAPIFAAYGVAVPGSFYIKDGKVINSFDDPAMKDALAFIQKMVKAGVVDPDLAANTGIASARDKAQQGKFGIIFAAWSDFARKEMIDQMVKINPNTKWVQLAAPKGPAGALMGTWDNSAGQLLAFSKTLEKQPEKMAKIVELLNYLTTKEAINLVQFGKEGRHYEVKDGKIVPTDLLAKEGGYFYAYQLLGREDESYLRTRFVFETPFFEYSMKLDRIQVFNGLLIFPKGYNNADVIRNGQEQLYAFLQGKRDLNEYDKFVTDLKTTFQYQVLIDSASKQLKDAGVVK